MTVSRDNELRAAYRGSTTVPSSFVPVKVTESVPTITTKDYELGTVTRYFTCPSNESAVSEIIEINKQTFTKLKSNNFYKVVTLPWIIRGPIDTTTTLTESGDRVILQYGVVEANSKSTVIATRQMPGLDKVVTNFVRFYQGL